MEDVTLSKGPGFQEMGRSQGTIGWQRFLEGMISKEILPIQGGLRQHGACKLTLEAWATGLMVKLLEVTHGQWLYGNVHVHPTTVGMAATARKEEIQQFIKDQLNLGEDGLDERDHYLLEITLEDLETSSGEDQHYWLLQIEAVRCEHALREATNSNNSQNQQEGGHNSFSQNNSLLYRDHGL